VSVTSDSVTRVPAASGKARGHELPLSVIGFDTDQLPVTDEEIALIIAHLAHRRP
jgi:hypothetical protein